MNFENKKEKFIYLTFLYFKKLKDKNNNLKYYLFGSEPFNHVKNGKFKFNTDFDIICNQAFFDEYIGSIDKYYHNKSIKIEYLHNSDTSFSSSPSMLKFNLIDKLIKIKIKVDDYIFKFDFVISSWYKLKEVITKYSENLLSNKTMVYVYHFDTNQIIPRFSHNLLKSLYRPNVYCCSFTSLMYFINLYLKIFDENGLKIDYDIVHRDEIKKLLSRDIEEKKEEVYIFLKMYKILIEENKSWITYESDIYLRFLFFNELFTLPLTENMKYYLRNMNLINKNEKNWYKRWFFLLKRFFTKETIDNFLEKNKLKDIEIDTSAKMKILLDNLKKNYSEIKKECTCYICMEEFELSSPLHTCENGHLTHLTCALQQKRIYINKKLKESNFDIEYEVDNNNKCGMCREEIIDENNLPMVNYFDIAKMYRYKDKEVFKFMNDNEYNDFLLDESSSINISECKLIETSSDYILDRLNYLKNITKKVEKKEDKINKPKGNILYRTIGWLFY